MINRKAVAETTTSIARIDNKITTTNHTIKTIKFQCFCGFCWQQIANVSLGFNRSGICWECLKRSCLIENDLPRHQRQFAQKLEVST